MQGNYMTVKGIFFFYGDMVLYVSKLQTSANRK